MTRARAICNRRPALPFGCRHRSDRQGQQRVTQRLARNLHQAREWLIHLEDQEDGASRGEGKDRQRREAGRIERCE
jgi:hypothetical protein